MTVAHVAGNTSKLRWLGRLLRPVRAGERHALARHPALAGAPRSIELVTEGFTNEGYMPNSCAGIGVGPNISPPLRWRGAPSGTIEFALVMEDLDVPLPRPLVHMIVSGLSPACVGLPGGALGPPSRKIPGEERAVGVGTYRGPRPPPGHGAHRYVFYVLALGRRTTFESPPRLAEFLKEVRGSVLAYGQLVGRYERS